MPRRILCLIAIVALCSYAQFVQAIDFQAKGQWMFNFEYGKYGQFTGGGKTQGFTHQYGGDDDFGASQRVRLQLSAIASEALSGTVYFEMGNIKWGKASQGGALGADGTIVELKDAYIDWVVPDTAVRVRMGIQNMTLPSFTTTSQIMSADVAAIVVNWELNENISLTPFWLRPYNGNFAGYPDSSNAGYMDNMDFIGLSIPLAFDGLKITAWGMYGMLGPNTFREGENWTARISNYYSGGLYPLLYGNLKNGRLSDYGNAWWAGLTGEVTAFEPWRFAWDFNYGSFRRDLDEWNREGWLASALLEYKLDWGIPGIHGWYASGDDDDPSNGSERLPYTDLDEGGGMSFDRFAFGGGRPNTFRDARIAHSMAGTWGVGIYLKDMSFWEDFKHTLTVNYMGGTNQPGLIKKLHQITGEWLAPNNPNGTTIGMEGLYMTTLDTALSVTIQNEWKMYENFTISLGAGYIHPMLDQSNSVWGHSRMNGRSDSVYDAWNIDCNFMYSF